ncbi:DctP family TRAP transporter solute-binding subunit [Pontibacillus yanchengensis]|uniref:DctP family TRAP transporter solute-binding subunit n=2 Tax=Pontibacillus yanchengensis TaxID=462910 RepID=A0ACC7VD34_9BACI|nr:TRAP transporter substrate-binding protein [Pontibacillus yanchengensis]MYL32103.1 DctP family TRAP transporter solute-binding subunit [Pontibacillus yanchengensis]MYL52683.1 DctP family TRAP transporter solute-binding subunit [Pontibacillus yanchengensis]
MNTFTKWFMYLVALSLVVFALAACNESSESGATTSGESSGDNSGKSYSFKLAHITPPTHMWHKGAEKFKEELEERSGGRMELEIYPSSQLGSEADMVEQIVAGSVDFGLITAAYMSSREQAFAAWFTPYAFEDLEAANDARDSEVAKKILGTLDQQGLVGLDYLFAGQRVMLFKDKEVKSTSDMDGLKLRVTPSPPMQDFYTSTGASTEGLPLPEVYSAVQTGVIDGMDMDLDATITNKYHEVVDHAAVTNHMVWPAIAMANKSTFEGMSEEDQQIVRESIKAAAEYTAMTRAGKEEDFKQQLKDEGMNVYELDESLFKEQKEMFDEKYGKKDPLIQEFIDSFR